MEWTSRETQPIRKENGYASKRQVICHEAFLDLDHKQLSATDKTAQATLSQVVATTA